MSLGRVSLEKLEVKFIMFEISSKVKLEFIAPNKIKLEKDLTELDKYVLKFVRILEKHTEYVIISGYVSLLLGRSRNTEDVDIYLRFMDLDKFKELYADFLSNGFNCMNVDEVEEIYSYLKDGLAVRIREGEDVIPNFELKFALRLADYDIFSEALVVETSGGVIKISSLERQIAFKKYYLCSPKDLEDAAYVEKVAQGHLDSAKIKKYQEAAKKLMEE